MSSWANLPGAQKWLITLSVMMVTVMQILDTSVLNVVLPHIQGSLSAGLEEVTWVLTSYLAANAIIIPATGWLAGFIGRRRFFLLCTTLFTVSSFLSGLAPNLTFLIIARIRPGMKAEVHVDTFSDRTFQGTVDSLAAGTGARFSLLPPENATGNWVKVVQRLPVKIRLDPGELGNPDTLRAGMSAVVTVKLH